MLIEGECSKIKPFSMFEWKNCVFMCYDMIFYVIGMQIINIKY